MSRFLLRLLVAFTVGLDLCGVFLPYMLLSQLYEHNSILIFQASSFIFGIIYLLLTWFLGGCTFLRWPWATYWKLLQRWFLIVFGSFVLALFAGFLLSLPTNSYSSSICVIALVQLVWGCMTRYWLQKYVRGLSVSNSDLTKRLKFKSSYLSKRKLVLLFVAYHPSEREVELLKSCLAELTMDIGYAVVVNDYRPGEPVDQLRDGADQFIVNNENLGYGRAVNRLVAAFDDLPPYIGVLNTDLSWGAGTFEKILDWLENHPKVSLAVPQILDENGTVQQLCKQNPTILGLFSRRFFPERFKPRWLKRYDHWYVMADQNYDKVFEVPYLSGCCVLIRANTFLISGGFDEQYFLYLEDADITRKQSLHGLCVHLPVAEVVHGWGRGNYGSTKLMLVNLISAWQYFRKWGWKLW